MGMSRSAPDAKGSSSTLSSLSSTSSEGAAPVQGAFDKKPLDEGSHDWADVSFRVPHGIAAAVPRAARSDNEQKRYDDALKRAMHSERYKQEEKKLEKNSIDRHEESKKKQDEHKHNHKDDHDVPH